jgi:signal transduction histidine kinase
MRNRDRLRHSLREHTVGLWSELQPASRYALLGLAAAAVVVVFLGTFLSGEVSDKLLHAEAHGLVVAVAAIEPSLPDIADRPSLTPDEIGRVDTLIRQSILSEDRVRVKLWALDGTILYSDVPALIGRRFPEEKPALAAAAAAGFTSEVSTLDDPENLFETSADQLIEYHLAVHRPPGTVVGVLQTFEDVAILENAVHQIALTTWVAIIGSLGLLVLFLVLLLRGTTRSITGQRAIAEGRVTELAILSTAAEALASSLEPGRLFETLERRIMPALGLERLALLPSGEAAEGMTAIPLRDGRLLVAQRAEPLNPDEERILRSAAHSLDAATANALLLAEVRGAASERQVLLQRVALAHEEERRTLVGELHDSLASDLIRTLYAIRRFELQVDGKAPDLAASIGKIETMVEDSEARLRAFMNRVRPTALDAFDLEAAVRDLVGRFERESGLATRLLIRGSVDELPEPAQVLLVRALEEALLNVRKHASATQVRVSLLQSEGTVTLTIDDDGTGWPDVPSAGPGRGLGLAYLRERVSGYGGGVSTTASRLGGARLRVRLSVAETTA